MAYDKKIKGDTENANSYAIVAELYQHQRAYNTPISILPNDGTFGNLASNAGVVTGGFTQGGVLQYSQRQTVRTIEFYSNSRYLLNQRDELGRDKPFYNIVNAICDIEDAAKDFSTKDIHVTADDEHFVESMLMTKEIYEWMKRVHLGESIDKSKQIHTRYGGVLAKKVMKEVNGEKTVFVEFPEWKNVVNDQIDILNGIIVEKHYMNRAQLFEKRGVWDDAQVDLALLGSNRNGREFSRFNIYELRGMFPRSYYEQVSTGGKVRADVENDVDFSYQYYVLAEITTKNCIPLYWEDDTERVYKYLPRKKKAGRALGVGVVEENEHAQIWINDTVQKQQRAFEYSSRVGLQSASKRLRSRNVLTEYDDGQVIEIEANMPLQAIPLVPPGGMAQFPQMIEQWWTQAQRTSSAYDSQAGEKPNSGTAFRTVALNTQQSQSVFNGLQKELGMFWEDIFNDWILPFLAKRLSTAHILSHNFNPDELNEIDKSFGLWTANRKYIERVLNGGTTTQAEYENWIQGAQQQLTSTKATRFLQIPKGYYKGMESRVTINIAGENQNRQEVMDSLANILKAYSANPALAQDAVATKIFMEIVEQSNCGISPVSLMAAIQEQAKRTQAAQQAQANKATGKVSESISFKDLPPEGKQQMAQQAGLQIGIPAQSGNNGPQPNQQQQPQQQAQLALVGGNR